MRRWILIVADQRGLGGRQAGPRSTLEHDAANTANPVTYVDKKDPPFLIMHVDNDQLVPLGQNIVLAKALIDAGIEVTLQTIAGAGHEGPEFRTADSQRLVEEFLNRHLEK